MFALFQRNFLRSDSFYFVRPLATSPTENHQPKLSLPRKQNKRIAHVPPVVPSVAAAAPVCRPGRWERQSNRVGNERNAEY